MPDFSIIAVTAARGAEQAEYDGFVAEFDDASEAKGYARRQAEDTHALAAQLDLDFDYSHVSVFTGEVDPGEADADDPAFVGMWLFADDGVDWASSEALKASAEDGAEGALDGAPDGTQAHTA